MSYGIKLSMDEGTDQYGGLGAFLTHDDPAVRRFGILMRDIRALIDAWQDQDPTHDGDNATEILLHAATLASLCAGTILSTNILGKDRNAAINFIIEVFTEQLGTAKLQ